MKTVHRVVSSALVASPHVQENAVQDPVPPNRILVAVDGSEQSLRAIRYAANIFPPDRTCITLFHIQAQLLDFFSDLGAYPHYKSHVTGLKRWATEQKVDIAGTMDSAVVYFKQRGFDEAAITIQTPSKKIGITEDLVKASYDDYQAIVVGRTGWSRFKDWLIKSTAMQLVAKIKHIPVVVVGGKPDVSNILVAFDGTHGAMKGVVCVGALVGSRSVHRLQLLTLISPKAKFWEGEENCLIPETLQDPNIFGIHPLGPQLEEARSRLMAEEIAPERITVKIQAVDRDRPSHIVREAMENQFGTIVLGRRGLISFIDAYLVGRVSAQVLKLADQLAVWIV